MWLYPTPKIGERFTARGHPTLRKTSDEKPIAQGGQQPVMSRSASCISAYCQACAVVTEHIKIRQAQHVLLAGGAANQSWSISVLRSGDLRGALSTTDRPVSFWHPKHPALRRMNASICAGSYTTPIHLRRHQAAGCVSSRDLEPVGFALLAISRGRSGSTSCRGLAGPKGSHGYRPDPIRLS